MDVAAGMSSLRSAEHSNGVSSRTKQASHNPQLNYHVYHTFQHRLTSLLSQVSDPSIVRCMQTVGFVLIPLSFVRENSTGDVVDDGEVAEHGRVVPV